MRGAETELDPAAGEEVQAGRAAGHHGGLAQRQVEHVALLPVVLDPVDRGVAAAVQDHDDLAALEFQPSGAAAGRDLLLDWRARCRGGDGADAPAQPSEEFAELDALKLAHMVARLLEQG